MVLKCYAFLGQQFPFPIQAAAEPADFPMRSEHAMAGHQNWNRVRAARAAHGAHGPGFANRLCNFPVASRFAERDFPHFAPDRFLKFRPLDIERRQMLHRTSGQKFF